MININNLKKEHIEKYVIYNKQKGRLKSQNDKWIFVVYHCDNDYKNYTACATDDLNFIKK